MSKRTSLMRLMKGLLGLVLAFGLAVGLSGCGQNDEQLIRASVTEALDTFKNPTAESLEKFIDESGADLSTVEQYGVDFTEFLTRTLKHFDYTINDVTVDGDTAEVSVTLTNADLRKALEAALSDITDLSEYADMLTGEDGQKEFVQMFMQKWYEQIEKSDELVSTDAVFKLTKTDGKWSVDRESIDEVVTAMYGGFEI